MASLFDLWDPPVDSTASGASPEMPETAFGILDDTLRSLHAARPQLLPLPATRGVSDLDARLGVYRAVEPPPSPTRVKAAAVATAADSRRASDPDVQARDALRELGEELAMLRMGIRGRAGEAAHVEAEQAAALLTCKYVLERLDTLPASPFVLLARRKARLQIGALRVPTAPNKAPAPVSVVASTSASMLTNSGDWGRRLQLLADLPQAKRAALRRLAALPETQRARLPAARRELAVFVGRLDALLAQPEALARRLPAEQQRLLNALRLQVADKAS